MSYNIPVFLLTQSLIYRTTKTFKMKFSPLVDCVTGQVTSLSLQHGITTKERDLTARSGLSKRNSNGCICITYTLVPAVPIKQNKNM